jgi:ABC-type sugar transport system permease subunit
MKRRWTPYLYLLPALLVFGVFTAYPVLRTIQMSFLNYDFLGGGDSTFIGLGNYWEALGRDPRAWTAFKNTLYFTLIFLPPYVLLPLPVAFLIDRLRRQTFMRIVTFLPVVVSGPVVAVLWVTFYDARGPLVALSKDLGFGQMAFLGSPKTAMPALAAMSVWHGLGFNVLLYLVRLASIPSELYEAAAVDGARGIDVFWRITRPLLRPAVYLVTVLGVIGSLKVFAPMFIMTDGGPGDTTLSSVMYIYKTAFNYGDLRFGYAAAMAVMLAVVITGFALVSSRMDRPVDE